MGASGLNGNSNREILTKKGMGIKLFMKEKKQN